MSLFTIILLLLVLVLCIALYFQMKGAKEQSEEGQQLLNDYQKRVNEMEKLLSDYRALEQNFDNVGKGYEQALLAFDKIEEDKQANERARQALENQNNELLASKN